MALRDIKLDSNNLLVIENFDLVIFSGIDRVVQAVRTKLKTYLTEWFNDETFGVPWLQSIIAANPRSDAVYNLLKAEILNVPEVDRIIAFDYEYDGRTRTVNCSCRIAALNEEADVTAEVPLT